MEGEESLWGRWEVEGKGKGKQHEKGDQEAEESKATTHVCRSKHPLALRAELNRYTRERGFELRHSSGPPIWASATPQHGQREGGVREVRLVRGLSPGSQRRRMDGCEDEEKKGIEEEKGNGKGNENSRIGGKRREESN